MPWTDQDEGTCVGYGGGGSAETCLSFCLPFFLIGPQTQSKLSQQFVALHGMGERQLLCIGQNHPI
jgi:hypothetical protein